MITSHIVVNLSVEFCYQPKPFQGSKAISNHDKLGAVPQEGAIEKPPPKKKPHSPKQWVLFNLLPYSEEGW